jgi:hypothetical protein
MRKKKIRCLDILGLLRLATLTYWPHFGFYREDIKKVREVSSCYCCAKLPCKWGWEAVNMLMFSVSVKNVEFHPLCVLP